MTRLSDLTCAGSKNQMDFLLFFCLFFCQRLMEKAKEKYSKAKHFPFNYLFYLFILQ